MCGLITTSTVMNISKGNNNINLSLCGSIDLCVRQEMSFKDGNIFRIQNSGKNSGVQGKGRSVENVMRLIGI